MGITRYTTRALHDAGSLITFSLSLSLSLLSSLFSLLYLLSLLSSPYSILSLFYLLSRLMSINSGPAETDAVCSTESGGLGVPGQA
jgi:hypothetical protein